MSNSRFDWNKFDADFDRNFKRTQRLAIGAVIFNALLVLAVLGGIGFVAYKVLVHFGII